MELAPIMEVAPINKLLPAEILYKVFHLLPQMDLEAMVPCAGDGGRRHSSGPGLSKLYKRQELTRIAGDSGNKAKICENYKYQIYLGKWMVEEVLNMVERFPRPKELSSFRSKISSRGSNKG